MKKLVALVLMVAALLGVAVTANAMVALKYIVNYEEVKGVEWDNRNNAPEIQVGIAYMIYGSSERYYKFCAPEDGDYILTTSAYGKIYNFSGEQVGGRCKEYCSIKIKLERNKVYWLEIDPDGMGSSRYEAFALCKGNVHPKSGIYMDVSMASCTEPGIQQSICQFCETIADERESAPAKGHVPGEWKTEREPACDKEGLRAQRCTVCNEIIASETLPAPGHVLGEWKTESEPTCTSKGKRAQRCTVCDKVIESETLPAKGHVPGEWKTEREPTCTKTGTKVQRCTVCGKAATSEIIPASHIPGEWKTTREPTCTTEGTRAQLCTVCGEVAARETLPKKAHTPGEMK